MCGIAGFFQTNGDFTNRREYYTALLYEMESCLRHRGPDENGTYLNANFGLAHARLSIIDLKTGRQPMCRTIGNNTYGIIYNGELYNSKELKALLIAKGCNFETSSDTEILLNGYMAYGPDFVKKLNGIFAFAIMDTSKQALYLFRDPVGVKPLFYTRQQDIFVFASEIKGLFAYPGIQPEIDKTGLNEIFGLGPAKTYGNGVFYGIQEVLAGHWMRCDANGMYQTCYWKLESKPHEDSYDTTVEKTSFLIQDAVKRQMVSDVPICSFLSGGVDSSLVSAICAQELKKQGKQLETFSFDFKDNEKWFAPNAFQPSQDRPYVEKMVSFLNSNHHFLECDAKTQADLLFASVEAHDLPAMADIDSSLLYFCSQVKPYCKVALTGECADEIFGGYPWFHKEACFQSHTFPWTMDLAPRKNLLRQDLLDWLNLDDYVAEAYEKSIQETPCLCSDSPEEARRREISYLNLKWFMQTLLDRMDRTSMYSGLEARIPFADYRIISYIWNVPWEMKTKGGIVKGLLREAGKGLLPEEVLYRKKSPYPKIYDTHYEFLLRERVTEMLHDRQSPILPLLDRKKVESFLSSPSDYGKPWFGQLMAGPQMLAYLLQINHWLKTYHVTIKA